MFQRSQYQVVKKRLDDEPRKFIQVLYGPRQVGKTTIVNQFIAQTSLPCHFISADAVTESQEEWLSQQWETARLKLTKDGAKEGVFIIDEVQKINNWAEMVKREWDADSTGKVGLKVLLLGSSRLLLQQGLTESLAGRFETMYVSHWSYSEMRDAFGLSVNQYVWFGGYPGAVDLIRDEQRWKKYITDSLIDTSISRDILMLTRIAKPALMKRLFELGCIYSGQILSYTKILGQLTDAGNTTTLANYLQLLDQAGLLGGIEKFNPDKIRQRSSSPKFMVHNTALMSALHDLDFDDVISDPAKWGRWVESAVGTHLVNNSISRGFELYYWRDRGDEVDFIMQHKGKTVGIEVKSGSGASRAGISAFKNRFKPHKVYLIGKAGLHWEEFLGINPLDLF